jgi:hypothetical protein
MKLIAYVLVAQLFSAVVFTSAGSVAAQQDIMQSYSFENDLEGWSVNATDVWGDAPVAWSVTRSQERAKDGSTSVKFDLVNSNDAEKIWIEKAFAVEPNEVYHVDVEYALASNEPSIDIVSSFTVITGVVRKSPKTRDDLAPAFKDSTRKPDAQSGYGWFEKGYDFVVPSDDTAVLYVIVGIWGDWEVHKTYYVDDVKVTFTKKPQGTEFFSFENDIEGWTSNGTDLDFGSGSIDWSIARVQQFALGGEDGEYSINFDLNNLNEKGKIWIERAFMVEPRRKYGVTVEYGLRSLDCGDTPKFRLITGVLRRSPEIGADLEDSVQEKTTSCMWGWIHKAYDFTIKSKKSDTLYVVIGIWGTEKAHRTYNVDSVCVTITPK